MSDSIATFVLRRFRLSLIRLHSKNEDGIKNF